MTESLAVHMYKDAALSRCKSYRYTLERRWGHSERRVVWVGLNPSTADHLVDDPTIRRMIAFAKSHDNADAITVVNLFALRSTSPTALRGHPDPVGPENDQYIESTVRGAARVVVCWGADPMVGSRHLRVLRMIEAPYCLGYTKSGHPRHPLYVRADAPFQEYRA